MSGGQGQGEGVMGSMSGGGRQGLGVGVRWSVGFSEGGGGLEINRECSFKELVIEFHSILFQSIYPMPIH